jgi:hypothetical protein
MLLAECSSRTCNRKLDSVLSRWFLDINLLFSVDSQFLDSPPSFYFSKKMGKVPNNPIFLEIKGSGLVTLRESISTRNVYSLKKKREKCFLLFFLFGKTYSLLHYVPVRDQNLVVRGKKSRVSCLIDFKVLKKFWKGKKPK